MPVSLKKLGSVNLGYINTDGSIASGQTIQLLQLSSEYKGSVEGIWLYSNIPTLQIIFETKGFAYAQYYSDVLGSGNDGFGYLNFIGGEDAFFKLTTYDTTNNKYNMVQKKAFEFRGGAALSILNIPQNSGNYVVYAAYKYYK